MGKPRNDLKLLIREAGGALAVANELEMPYGTLMCQLGGYSKLSEEQEAKIIAVTKRIKTQNKS